MAERLWLIRHAETEWTVAHRHTGRTDIPLTERGRERARELSSRLAAPSFSRVLSSPLARARETAELAGLDAVELSDDLREWDYGAYEGRTTAEIRAERPAWSLWRDGCPDGESADDVAARVDRVLAGISATDGDVAVVAHAHVLRVLAARWLEQPPQLGARLVLAPGSVSVLGWERETRVISRWNEC